MVTDFFLPSQDIYVSAQQPETNFGGSQKLITGLTTTNFLQAFVQFDISTLPREITITSASLQLYLQADSDPAVSKVVPVYPVLQTWKNNELNFLNQPTFETTPVDTVIIQGQVGTFFTWNMLSVVQEWHSGAIYNNGVVVRNVFNPVTFASSRAIYTTTRIRPLLTVEYQTTNFINKLQQNLVTTDEFQYSDLYNVSGLQVVSFFINNTGAKDAVAQLEVSPDAVTFLAEGIPTVINAGMNAILVPQFFIQYVRVKYQSANPGEPTILDIWFQGQVR